MSATGTNQPAEPGRSADAAASPGASRAPVRVRHGASGDLQHRASGDLRREPGVVSCRGLERRFGTKRALLPLDLDVGPGVTGLLGPNGSGKSTFMRCLVGLVPPDAGRAAVDGVELARDGVAVRRRLTYTPGELHLYGELRGSEHLFQLLRGRGRAAVERAAAVARALDLPLERRVRGYSHGMKRQLLFAAAMGPDVPVRILDEPTEGLDPSKRQRILELLLEDAAAGRTVLLSSHHLGEVDAACGRIVFLAAGECIGDESASEVRARAARLVRLWYAAGPPTGIETALAGPGVERVSARGDHVSVLLGSADPRPLLERLGAPGLPAPSALEHGRASLSELYRELYGVEGL